MNLTQRIFELVLITCITLLIWLFAEARNVQTFTPGGPIPIRIVAAGKDMVVTSQSPTRATMRFKGASAELDKLRRTLGEGLVVSLPATEPGAIALALGPLLAQSASLSNLSVNILDLEPEQARVMVDRLAQASVSPVFRPLEVQLVGGAAQIKPSKVTVIGPQSLLGAGIDAMAVDLETEADVKALAPGVEQTLTATVKLPIHLRGSEHVRVEPATVQLVFTIDKKEDAFKLPGVPVFVATPPGEQDRYRITLAEESRVLKDVKVVGPSELVQRIRAGEVPVIATLRLSGDDLVKAVDKETTGTVRFDLPPGLTVEAPLAAVRYNVTRRAP
jgi:hypothetical protein